jgi:hypothetical protein
MKTAPTWTEWLKMPRLARLIILDATEVAIDEHNAALEDAASYGDEDAA